MDNTIGIIPGVNSFNSSTTKKASIANDGDGKFTKLLKNASSKKTKEIPNSKIKGEEVKEVNIPSNENNDGNKMKSIKDIQKIKSLLKKSGFSEDDLKKVKIDDMDKLLSLSIKDINLNDLNISELISLLQYLVNTNVNNENEEKLSDNISELIENTINSSSLDLINGKVDSSELLNKIKVGVNSLFNDEIKGTENAPLMKDLLNSIEDKLGSMLQESIDQNNTLPKEDMITAIKNEIIKNINGEEKDLKADTAAEGQYKAPIDNVDNADSSINYILKDKHSDNHSNEESAGDTYGEEKILKSISGDDKKDKFSKAVNFINQFNSLNKTQDVDLTPVEKLVVNKDNMVSDIVKAVKYMEVNNTKNLTVKINPKELGEMVINITMENGKMKANITANNKEAFNLLNANASDINDKLQNSNIKIENFSLNLYEDTTFFKDKEGKGEESKYHQKNRSKENRIDGAEDIVESNVSEDLSNLNIFA